MLANDKQGHADFQKPGFNILITDQNGNQLACSYYDVQLSTLVLLQPLNLKPIQMVRLNIKTGLRELSI
jgi:hypothetical protein